MIQHFKDVTDFWRGDVKDILARRVTRIHFESLLIQLGLEFVHFFDRHDLITLLRRVSGMDKDHRQSFHRADLVLKAATPDSSPCYVAAEAAYAAGRRDADRALRHADYVQRCTGSPVHAVVSSVHVAPEVQRLVADGTVHWYRLKDEDLEEEWQDKSH